MSVVDELIGEGEVDSRGSFTVDVEKANEKLERFRLADPLGYVLELVQAAVLAGATRVDVDVTARDFVMSFDGRLFSAADLTDLEAALLVRNPADHPARQQLALGVSAARALEPTVVLVRSGATQLSLTGEGGSVAAVDVEPGEGETTTVKVRERFEVGHFVDFFRGAFGLQKEERLLRERCSFSRTTIVVNGTTISGAPTPADVLVTVVKDAEHRLRARTGGDDATTEVGSVGFQRGSVERARVIIVRAGVVQEVVEYVEEGVFSGGIVPAGLVAIVEVSHLKRDASFTRFVRDEAFFRLLHEVVDVALANVPALAAHLSGADPHERWARDVLRELVLHLGPMITASPQAARLRDAPLFANATKDGFVSVGAVIDDVKRHGRAAVVTAALDPARLEPPRVVVHLGEWERRLLERLEFEFDDVTDDVIEAHAREQRRQRWRERRAPVALGANFVGGAQHGFRDGDVSGVVGLRASGPEAMEIVVLADHCHLTTLSVPFAVPRLSVVLDGPFTPSLGFDDVVRDVTFSDALTGVLGLVPDLFVTQGSDAADDARVSADVALRSGLIALLALLLDGDALARSAREALGCAATTKTLPRLSMTHAALRARTLRTLRGDFISLDDVVAGRGPVGVVPIDAVFFDGAVEPTLHAGDNLRAVLRAVAPHRAIVNLHEQATQAVRRRDLARRPADALALAGAAHPVALRGDRRGVVGVVSGGPRGKLTLFVSVDGRRTLRTTLPSPVSGLSVAVDDPARRLSSRLEAIGPFDDLVDLAFDHVAAVVAAEAAAGAGWSLAAEIVSAFLPTKAHALALRRIEANLSPADTRATWAEILALSNTQGDGDVAAALELLLDEGVVPTVDKVRRTLDTRATPTVDADERVRLFRRVFASTGSLREALVTTFALGALSVRRLNQTWVPLSTVLAQPIVRFVSTLTPAARFADVVVLDGIARSIVAAVHDRVEDASNDVAAAAAEEAFALRYSASASIPADVVTVGRIAVADVGIRGEVALLAEAAATKPRAELTLLFKGKPLAVVAIGRFVGVALVAAIDVDDITPNATWTDVEHDAKFSRVIDAIKAARDQLLEPLLEGYATTTAAPVRARLIERFLVSYTDRKRGLPTGTSFAARFANLGLFAGLDGRWRSLHDLDGDDDAPVRYVGAADGEVVEGFEDVIVVVGAAERDCLARIFELDNVEKSLADARRLQATKRSLPVLPSTIDDALVVHQVRIGRHARLLLALPATPPRSVSLVASLRVGDDDLEVAAVDVPALPARGIFSGSGAVTRDFARARIDGGMATTIANETAALWGRVLEQYAAAPGEPLRAWIAAVALAVSRRDLDGAPPTVLAVRQRLRDARAFAVDGGGLISLETALREQPEALLPLLREHGLLKAEPAEAAAPKTTTTTPPPTAPPTPLAPSVRLRDRLLGTIAVVRDSGEKLTTNLELSRLYVEQGDGKAPAVIDKRRDCVVVDFAHPLVAAALEDDGALLLLTSLCVTRINERLESVSDDDEKRFHEKLIAFAAAGAAVTG